MLYPLSYEGNSRIVGTGPTHSEESLNRTVPGDGYLTTRLSPQATPILQSIPDEHIPGHPNSSPAAANRAKALRAPAHMADCEPQ